MAENLQKYQSLDHLLKSNKRKPGGPFTHTRIGDVDKNIYAGSYNIIDELLPQFWKLYYKEVFEDGRSEYLTETQNKDEGGALLVDIDMRFSPTTQKRVYELSEISDIIELYADSLMELLCFSNENKIKIPVFVFEKKNIVKMLEKNYVKDGLHLVIGLRLHHAYQLLLREIVIEKEKLEHKIFGEEGLNCINSIEDIFDKCISSGRNNWQVWGSKKPGYEAYELKYIWNIIIENNEFQIELETNKITNAKIKELIPIVSAKNKTFTEYKKIKDKYKKKLLQINCEINTNNKKKKKKNNISSNNIKLLKNNINNNFPKSEEELDIILHNIFNEIDIKDYHLREIHDLIMILDETYYNPFQKWIDVGWALHNTHDLLFWTWIKFSSKSDKFNWSDIAELANKWTKEMYSTGFSWRSIYFWCKRDFPEQYNNIRNKSIDKFIWATLMTKGADTDIAILAKHLCKGEYSCTSIKLNKWYRFNGHKWKENDCGTSLRSTLSTDLNKLYVHAAISEKEKSVDESLTVSQREKHLQNAHKFNTIAINLKTACKKTSIMKECMEQFWDGGQITQKLDQNKYLLGFENGIYDFKNKVFRKGEPEDYVSFSTQTNYIPFDPNDKEQQQKKDEIDDFMLKVFPNNELRKYMWEHAASCLIGEQRNQKFNIYTGIGGNGKSIWVNLMNLVLGDYSDKLNIALITQKRKGIGGPTPEIAKLKGKRYVSMDEPSAGDVLNEGIMKQMVGGDEMEGREMYGRHMIKFYPQFELVCCTNRLFEINSTDKGTWRRIRQVDFRSEFLDEQEYEIKNQQNLCNDPEHPIYLKDDELEKKLPSWVQVFTALLIEIVNKTGGKVKDCNMVIEASNRYQEKQDFYALFCKEKIARGREDQKIKKTDIRMQFQNWYQENYQQKPPKSMELYDYLDKKLCKYRKRGWWGYKIIYEPTDSEDEEDCTQSSESN